MLEKIFRFKKTDPFDQAPYLFPWYIDKHKPKLTLEKETLPWKYVDKIGEEYVGIVTLNYKGKAIGVFNAYVYIQTSSMGDRFCVWTRSPNINTGIATLTVKLYFTKDLRPFDESEKAILQLDSDKEIYFILNGEPRATITFQLNPKNEVIQVDFPEEFKAFDEFITVSDIPNLYPNGKSGWNNTAFVVINPKLNLVSIYPQDWFNQDDQIDFGYQWITRAVRNKDNNKILGQGIRIGKFELDNSNRQVKHWL